MATLVMPDILTEILDEEPIAYEKIVYLQTRAKLRLHDLILRKFATAEDEQKIDQATVARRLGQTRARISQQLSVPGNWTIDSVTKLAAAIGGEIDFNWRDLPNDPSKAVEEMMAHAKKEEPPAPQSAIPTPKGSGQQARP
jgi:hypothetical protein